MNRNWIKFLTSLGAVADNSNRIVFKEKHPERKGPWLCPLSRIGVLEFSGSDAATFLQGQITCDIFQLSDPDSCLGAYCNQKGRVISVFRMIRKGSRYYWIIPEDLVSTVIKRLRMYVMRSDVAIHEVTAEWCAFGVAEANEITEISKKNIKLPTQTGEVAALENLLALMPSSSSKRLLFMAKENVAEALWNNLSKDYIVLSSTQWESADIADGIPNISIETSEQFTPQMLNLDKLNAINFSKGCYIGQEIVARTHYLGKLKRRMYLAQSQSNKISAPNSPIYHGDELAGPSIGNLVASTRENDGKIFMLVVLQIADAVNDNLRIESPEGARIKLLSLPYAF